MAENKFTQRLKLKYPLIVAPMAGTSSPELVTVSSHGGALGSVGAAYMKASAIEDFVNQVRQKTKSPIAINLFIPQKTISVSETQIATATAALEKYRQELGLKSSVLKPPYEENFDQQIETVLRLKPEVFSFVFGLLKPEYIKAAHQEKIYLIGTATTLEEALLLQESKVDAITLQGFEAGGHRGIFDATSADPEISIFNLIDQCRPQIKIPIVAAGGLMTAEGIKKALACGAEAVQLGTAFMACREAGTNEAHRARLLQGAHRKTKLTRAFSGRWARGIENRFMVEVDNVPESILPFPAQNKFTRDIRNAAAEKGLSDYLSLWAGTGQGNLWTGSAVDLIQQLFQK